MGLMGVARANTSAGVNPKTLLLLLLQERTSQGTSNHPYPIGWLAATMMDLPSLRQVFIHGVYLSHVLHCSHAHFEGKPPPQFFSAYAGASRNS
jgi:hypothetical protein